MSYKKFYFSTGVKFAHYPYLCKGQEVSPSGIKVIPFECEDVPENATFLFGCDQNDLPESEYMVIREIKNSTLLSKYAYFRV